MEIGPYRLKDGESLEYNNGSWDEFANLLFIDNPVGTGYSSVDSDSYIHELTTMADNVVSFFEKYFTIFPQEENNEVWPERVTSREYLANRYSSTSQVNRTLVSTFPTSQRRFSPATKPRQLPDHGI
jgi:hypothetical protein